MSAESAYCYEKMKKKKTGIFGIVLNIAIAVSAIGMISLALYPTIGNWINQMGVDNSIVVYNNVVQDVDTSELDKLWDEAKEFNKKLAGRENLSVLTDEEKEEYDSLLNVNGNGAIGYIDIPDQNIHLTIYHGTDDETLSTAVGHFEGTSLPTDGESVHSVITGHTGLPTFDLFTDIHNLEIGDQFTLTVLNRILTYEVDDINVVLPEELYNIQIEEGRNYCTLVTCTPYGINDHRLLVRGKLVDVETSGTTRNVQKSYLLPQADTSLNDIILYIGAGICVIGVITLIAIGIMYWKHYRRY